jgi:uncharacterized protein with HEPN domain
MRPESGDASYLWDMLDAASAIREFTAGKSFHVLAHEYGEVKHESIWRVTTIHTLELIEQLEPLVPPPPGS